MGRMSPVAQERRSVEELEDLAFELRQKLLNLCGTYEGAVHIGGDLSSADIFTVLFEYGLNVDPTNLANPTRDRFVLSKGHAAVAMYIAMAINEVQRDRVHALVMDAVASGAELRAGGTYEDLFYRPTVLANTPAEAPAYCEEVFGPVASVVKFSTDEEAVALASATDYGLSLGIVTKDALAGWDLAQQIPTGIVHINDQTVNDEANTPFGGTGASGTGSRHGGAQANIDALTETRWITMRREPYPVRPGRSSSGGRCG